MNAQRIDWKSLLIGLLIGTGILLTAALGRQDGSLPLRYEIVSGSATYVIDTVTGDVWFLYSIEGSDKYTWTYAGSPPQMKTDP